MKDQAKEKLKICFGLLESDFSAEGMEVHDHAEIGSFGEIGQGTEEELFFKGWIEILIPTQLDLPSRTNGQLSHVAIDVNAPQCPSHPDCIFEVTVTIRNRPYEIKWLRNHTQRYQFIIPTSLLFGQINSVILSAKVISGSCESPAFFVKLLHVDKETIFRRIEENSVWVFSTARSGSTWLTQDLLCWDDNVRPMDEPGIGKMFAPLDWVAERFFDLPKKPFYFPSGREFEMKEKSRMSGLPAPPFERAFIFSERENQIWNRQNWLMYKQLIRDVTFQHVLNEWGFIDYHRVVFKMPNDSHAADVIMEAFPKSFMVFLVRDGRDAMKSRFSPFASPDLASTSDSALRQHAIAFYSHFWNFQIDLILSAFTAHSPKRRMLLHYETLRQSPADELRTLFRRVGMPITSQELDDLIATTKIENIAPDQKGPEKPRQTGEVGRYGDAFSTPEIDLMNSIMGTNLRRFGYDLALN